MGINNGCNYVFNKTNKTIKININLKTNKMKKMTQKERVVRHLNDKGSITSLEAMQEYGIMRLTSRICELKDEGYKIRSEFVSSKNRYNEPVSFSKYSLMN